MLSHAAASVATVLGSWQYEGGGAFHSNSDIFRMYVLATAAAREASNGPDFIHQAETILNRKVRVLSGEEEAKFASLGIISGFYNPDGIAGDLGGGSLELIDIKGKEFGKGITLPLGGLRLSEYAGGSLSKAQSFARKQLKTAKLLSKGEGRTFYAVGGTWRNIAKLHMLLVGAKNLREISLFPMNQQAQDLLMGAPSPASPTQLRELSIRPIPPVKKD